MHTKDILASALRDASLPLMAFVTQLIATAELIPQTCALRRATPTEALAAYRSTANQNQTTVTGARMRQIA